MRSTSSPRAATSVAIRMSSCAVLQRGDGALAHGLRDVAVDGRSGKASCAQSFGDLLGGLLGADEDDHRLERLDLQHPGQGVHLAGPGHLDVALRDVLCGLRFRLDRHLDRVVQVFRGDLADGGRHSGREQRHLLVLGGVGQDPFDVLGEPHVEHLVGLVEHQIVEVGEVEAALLEVVDDPARRADDDLRTPPESRELRTVGGAAVDGQHVDGQVGTVTTERLGDLQRQLAGGRQHQRLSGLVGGVDLGQDRDGERRGLAGAGLCKADDVGTGHHGRNRGGLDCRRGLVPDVGNRPQHRRVKLQVSEVDVLPAINVEGSRAVMPRLGCFLLHHTAPPGWEVLRMLHRNRVGGSAHLCGRRLVSPPARRRE